MNEIKPFSDPALTLTTIQEFRRLLDIMEEFIKSTEAERPTQQQKECADEVEQS